MLCGNAVVDSGEDCEVGNLNGATCVTRGFLGGTLVCGAGCRFDTSNCYATRFVDNGDGTITDHQTRLMWEKKTGTVGSQVNCGGTTCTDPRDVNNVYRWSASGSAADGVLFTDFLPRTNGLLCATSSCTGTGGHSDWRLPTLAELQTIADPTAPGCGFGSPCISSVFGPTVAFNYWSASTLPADTTNAWIVGFDVGASAATGKSFSFWVRAVRGGP